MRKPGGYSVVFGPGATVESDTFTCGHCQFIVTVEPKQAPEDTGGLCKMCMKLICKGCVDKGLCTPWEREYERMEARERFRRSAGL